VDLAPDARASPLKIVVMHLAPRRQVMGQHAPAATTLQKVEDAVEQFAQLHRALASVRSVG